MEEFLKSINFQGGGVPCTVHSPLALQTITSQNGLFKQDHVTTIFIVLRNAHQPLTGLHILIGTTQQVLVWCARRTQLHHHLEHQLRLPEKASVIQIHVPVHVGGFGEDCFT